MWNMVLYPTDFSETAENALPHALTLSVLLKARLTLLHVRVLMEDDPGNPQFHFPQMEEIYREAESIARGLLDHRKEGASGLQVTTRIRRGLTADDAILAQTSEEQADLIVMGTHGRRGLDHYLLGSTAQAVTKKSPVAVCTVRKDVPAPDPELHFRRCWSR
jgi:nucleotide-binding universal stress UspA family protein